MEVKLLEESIFTLIASAMISIATNRTNNVNGSESAFMASIHACVSDSVRRLKSKGRIDQADAVAVYRLSHKLKGKKEYVHGNMDKEVNYARGRRETPFAINPREDKESLKFQYKDSAPILTFASFKKSGYIDRLLLAGPCYP